MTKTLTEQWREGELQFGVYYVKFPNEKPQIYSSEYLKSFTVVKDAGRIDILAPVPSYDKVKEMSQKIDKLKKQLEIATNALNDIRDVWANNPNEFSFIARIANRKAKTALEEMEGVK